MTAASRQVNISRAQVSLGAGGCVTFDDPTSSWVVKMWVGDAGGRPYIRRVRVDNRGGPAAGITASGLGRMPVAQMLQVASATSVADSHPNEVYYRMLATPRPVGQRSWDDEHWDRVLTVFEWARSSRRPGGGQQAVADMWRVTVNPTALRWLAEARRRRRERMVR